MKNYWEQADLGLITVAGAEARDFLQRLTSQDFRFLKEGESVNGAALTPTSQIVALFSVVLRGGKFHLLCESKTVAQVLLGFLEKFHFAEDLSLQNESDGFSYLSAADLEKPVLSGLSIQNRFLTVFLFQEPQDLEKTKTQLQSQGFKPGTPEDLIRQRAAHSMIQWGVDLSEKNLILEGPLADFVSRNKGCYPGQEVVERVFTYGNVSKKLVRLAGQVKTLAPSSKLIGDDKEVGTVTSVVGETAFAMVRKPHYENGTKLTVDQKSVTVETLPYSFEIEKEKTLLKNEL